MAYESGAINSNANMENKERLSFLLLWKARIYASMRM